MGVASYEEIDAQIGPFEALEVEMTTYGPGSGVWGAQNQDILLSICIPDCMMSCCYEPDPICDAGES